MFYIKRYKTACCGLFVFFIKKKFKNGITFFKNSDNIASDDPLF